MDNGNNWTAPDNQSPMLVADLVLVEDGGGGELRQPTNSHCVSCCTGCQHDNNQKTLAPILITLQ